MFISICSLDVEGSEFPILKTIPFDKVDIKVLDVEVNVTVLYLKENAHEKSFILTPPIPEM